MDFKQFLARQDIQKKIDPVVGREQGNKAPITDTPPPAPQDTDPELLVRDLLDKAESIAQQIEETIVGVELEAQESVEANELGKMLRAKYFDARTLLANPEAQPPPYSVPEMRRLQRSVYETTMSPRLPRLADLWRLLETVRALQMQYEYAWKKIVGGNALYSKPKRAAQKVRTALSRESRSLDQLVFELNRIRFSEIEPLQDSFYRTLADQVFLELQGSLSTSQSAGGVSNALQKLRQLEILIEDTMLDNTEVYEKLEGSLQDAYGSILDFITRSLILTQPYAVLNGVQPSVLEFLQDLDDPTLTNELHHVLEFERQIQQALFRNVKKIEDSMISKEDYTAQHTRQVLDANIAKKIKSQQFLSVLRKARSYLGAQPGSASLASIMDTIQSLSKVMGGA